MALSAASAGITSLIFVVTVFFFSGQKTVGQVKGTEGTIIVYGHTNLQKKQINVHTLAKNTTFIHYRGLTTIHLLFFNSAEKIKIKKPLSSKSGIKYSLFHRII